MAKVLEEIIVLKLSKIVKDNDRDCNVISSDQRQLIEQAVPALIDEVLNDTSIIVEIAPLE